MYNIMLLGDEETDTTTTLTATTPPPPHHVVQYISLVCICATVASVSMMLLNKAIISVWPFSAVLILIQNMVTVCLIQMLCSTPRHLEFNSIVRYAPCSMLFAINTFTSMQALSFLSVTTFTIFRNTQAILSYPLDYVLRGEALRTQSVYFLILILFGTCAYCSHDLPDASIAGCLWAAAHVVSTTVCAVTTKITLEGHSPDVAEQAMLDLAWLNNILSIPILAPIAAVQLQNNTAFILSTEAASASGPLSLLVILSCFGGCVLSICSIRVQALLTPVTYLTFNNLNKIPAMLLSTIIWPSPHAASPQEIIGIVLSVYGGYLYALSKEHEVHWVLLLTSAAIVATLVPLLAVGH